MTTVTKPGAETWRGVIKANPDTTAQLWMSTDQTWLPNALVEGGFFDSTSRVKKNRPDLWRNTENIDFFELSWCEVDVVLWTAEHEASHIARRGHPSTYDPAEPIAA